MTAPLICSYVALIIEELARYNCYVEVWDRERLCPTADRGLSIWTGDCDSIPPEVVR